MFLDSHLLVPMKKWREQLLHLKTRWTNPFASAIRFDSHVSTAREVAERLAGTSPSIHDAATWTQPFVITSERPGSILPVELDFDPAPIPRPDPDTIEATDAVPSLDPSQTLVADILGADWEADEPDEILDTHASSEQTNVSLVWVLPVCPSLICLRRLTLWHRRMFELTVRSLTSKPSCSWPHHLRLLYLESSLQTAAQGRSSTPRTSPSCLPPLLVSTMSA
jgi:hypothetical protein